MSTVQTCDDRCHKAKRPRCACWCAGLFHGAAGDAARAAFREVYGKEVPRMVPGPDLFDEVEGLSERWAHGIAAAVAARKAVAA